MARYVTSLSIPRSIDDSFAFVSDFRNAIHWDPATREAYKVTDGPVGLGTRFLLLASVWGLFKHVLPYEIITCDPPREVVLAGESDRLIYRDRLALSAAGDERTRLDYDATLEWRGILAMGDPILQMAFQRIGAAATRGMPDAVANRAPRASRPE